MTTGWRTERRWTRGFAVVVAMTFATPVATSVAVSTDSTSAVSTPPPSDEAVLAQGLSELEGGDYVWSWVVHEITSTASHLPSDEVGFLVALGDSTVLLSDPFAGALLLTDGEAVHHRADQAVPWTAIALAESGGRSASGALGELTLASSPPGDDTFRPGAGWHDVELSRRVVGAGESFEVLGDSPAFVIAGHQPFVDEAGAAVPVDASVVSAGQTLVNAGRSPVAVLVATVGPVTELDGAATPLPTPSASDVAITPPAAPQATTAPSTSMGATGPTTATTAPPATTQNPATTLAATTTTTRTPTTTTRQTTTTQQATTTVGAITTRTTTTIGGITTARTVPR